MNKNISTFNHLPIDKWGFPILSVGNRIKNELTGNLNEVVLVEDKHHYTNGGHGSTYGYFYHLKIISNDDSHGKIITLTPAMVGNFNWEFIS